MITFTYVQQDFLRLIANPSNYVLSEPSVRVLTFALSQQCDSDIVFLPVDRLKSQFECYKAKAKDEGDVFRVQFVIQLPIRCGVHYVAADVEFSPSYTSCILIDAALNKESLAGIKKKLSTVCNAVYFADSCEEINLLQVDYSSCPIFSTYHAKCLASWEGDHGSLTAIAKSSGAILWRDLPVDFLFPIQSISKAKAYAAYQRAMALYTMAASLLGKAETGCAKSYLVASTQLMKEIERHAVLLGGYTVNGFVRSITEEFSNIACQWVASYPNQAKEEAWSAPKYKAIAGFVSQYNSVDFSGLITCKALFTFMRESKPSQLRKVVKSKALCSEHCRRLVEVGDVDLFYMLQLTSPEAILENPVVKQLMRAGLLVAMDALKLPVGRLAFLNKSGVIAVIESKEMSCLEVLRLPTARLKAIAGDESQVKLSAVPDKFFQGAASEDASSAVVSGIVRKEFEQS